MNNDALFTGRNVQRCLGKWNAAAVACLLRMWPDVRKHAVRLNKNTWVQVTGLRAVPAELAMIALPAEEQSMPDAKMLGHVAAYARHMSVLGAQAYADLARRLHVLALAITPTQFVAARAEVRHDADMFLNTAFHCAATVQDDALGATLAYLLVALPDDVKHVGVPVGSHTPAPLSWAVPHDVLISEWSTTLPAPPHFTARTHARAYWALLSGPRSHGAEDGNGDGDSDGVRVARFDIEEGVTEWDVPHVEGMLAQAQWKWIASVTPFRREPMLILFGVTHVVQLTLIDSQQHLRVERVLRLDDAAQPSHHPHEQVLGRSSNYVGWRTAANGTVLFDLHALQVETDADTIATVTSDMIHTHAPGAQQNFIYVNGRITAALPAEQCIVAVTQSSTSCVDAFSRSNDWWRLVRAHKAGRGSSSRWEAHVLGLSLQPGWTVVNVCE
jgi:hypothetical protein